MGLHDNWTERPRHHIGAAPAQSVLSVSEESLSSGEDLTASDLGLPSIHHDYKPQGSSGTVLLLLMGMVIYSVVSKAAFNL